MPRRSHYSCWLCPDKYRKLDELRREIDALEVARGALAERQDIMRAQIAALEEAVQTHDCNAYLSIFEP